MALGMSQTRGARALTRSAPRVAFSGVRGQPRVQPSVCTRAGPESFQPTPQLLARCKEEFPDKGVANPDEATTLMTKCGYTYIDVRPTLEIDEVGKYKGAINVPFMNAKKVYNQETREKSIVKEENTDFIPKIMKMYPDKETPLLIGCSDGKAYSIDALMALDENGYTHIVGLQGGYYRWFKVFDNNLRRRRGDGYVEMYDGEGSDSCLMHATGAGFERADKIEAWVPPKY